MANHNSKIAEIPRRERAERSGVDGLTGHRYLTGRRNVFTGPLNTKVINRA